ncbi:hypothetical protein GCM10009836_48540 [Pseudonocardia ailaonensis]|uniref:Uncharacterized protein n=1 Tax=Pseudonocardia ailaonensis TaxID=367279 RepID=A0ABN2NDB9_9PSEU
MLAGAGVGAYYLFRGSPTPVAGPATSTTTAPAPLSRVASRPATSPPSSQTAPPGTLLTQEVLADRPAVESLVGTWIPQLGSKQVGLVVNGVRFDEAAIWGDFQNIRTRFPQALLLRSDDYRSFRSAGFWVTVMPLRFSTPQDANRWCASVTLSADDCFAKRLSHTEGPEGNSQPR